MLRRRRRRRVFRSTTHSLRFPLGILLLASVVGGGAAGYHAIEGWTWPESVYMTFITVSTVGFKEVHELSTTGRYFTMILILCGVGTLAFTASSLVEFVLQRQVQLLAGINTMKKEISSLRGHTIVCGFGRGGHLVTQRLEDQEVECVVVEQAQEEVEHAAHDGFLVIEGNAVEEETLELAGIHHARSLVAALGTDADNLFLTLTARVMNKDIEIIVRAHDEGTERKFVRAGANHVVLPEVAGAEEIARTIIRASR